MKFIFFIFILLITSQNIVGQNLTRILFILDEINHLTNHNIIEVITPLDEKQRGCQVSMLMLEDGKRIFDELIKAGIIADWREPNVIRIAPVPLYNTFEDIFNFGKVIKESLIK